VRIGSIKIVTLSFSKRGGLMGLLGGLALGGLLGSLFFGGAFENFNFMDILIFGGIAYLLYKLFAAKAGRPRTSGVNNYARNTTHTESLNSSYQRNNHEPACAVRSSRIKVSNSTTASMSLPVSRTTSNSTSIFNTSVWFSLVEHGLQQLEN
jgi:predicted lipid-binding transport protein (Tim44 family)